MDFSLCYNKYLIRRTSNFTTNPFQRLLCTCTNIPINILCEVCIWNDNLIMHSGGSQTENNYEILKSHFLHKITEVKNESKSGVSKPEPAETFMNLTYTLQKLHNNLSG